MAPDVTAPPGPRGLARYRTLWRLFRDERQDPAPFYRTLARDLVADLERRHGALRGQQIFDLGCGPGWYTEVLRERGARVAALDGGFDEMHRPDGSVPAGAIHGDATRLPMRDATADGVVCSNLLEHTQDTRRVLEEIRRVLRPGGWAYVSWTNWYSPHGGHDMSPWHLLGTERGPRLYERRHGPPAKNRAGEGLFPVHIGPTLRLVEGLEGLRLDRAEPRYWPWARAVLRVPGAREVLTWNCVLHLTRVEQASAGRR